MRKFTASLLALALALMGVPTVFFGALGTSTALAAEVTDVTTSTSSSSTGTTGEAYVNASGEVVESGDSAWTLSCTVMQDVTTTTTTYDDGTTSTESSTSYHIRITKVSGTLDTFVCPKTLDTIGWGGDTYGDNGKVDVTETYGSSTTSNVFYNAKDTLKSATFQEGFTTIGQYTFSGGTAYANDCTNLETVNFPTTLVDIGQYAFACCYALTGLDVTCSGAIGNYAFYGLTAAKEVSVTAGGTLGNYVFAGTSSVSPAIESADITAGGAIGTYLLEYCTALKTASVEAGGNIGTYSFAYCSALEDAYVDCVGSIGNYAFRSCTALKTLEFGDNVTQLSTATGTSSTRTYFTDSCTSLETVTIGSGMEAIGSYAFGYSSASAACSSLKKVTIASGNTLISYGAFYNCTSLEEVEFQTGTANAIGPNAFYNCTSLTEFTIPVLFGTTTSSSTTARVSSGAFQGCSNLETVYFEAGYTSLASYLYGRASFNSTSKLSTLVFYGTMRDVDNLSAMTDDTTKLNLDDYDVYVSIDCYGNEADAQAASTPIASPYDPDSQVYDTSARIARITTRPKASAVGVFNGDSRMMWQGSDSVPSAGQGKVWGLTQYGGLYTMQGAAEHGSVAVPTDTGNFNYAWLNDQTDYYYAGGAPDLANLVVYAADGTAMDSSSYDLVVLRHIGTYDPEEKEYNFDPFDIDDPSTYEVVGGIEDITIINDFPYYLYTVYAVGTGSYKDVTTNMVTLTLWPYADVTDEETGEKLFGNTEGYAVDATASSASAQASSSISAEGSEKPLFSVVADSSDAAAAMVGAGLSGVAGGPLLLSDNEKNTSDFIAALKDAGSADAYILESSPDLVSSDVELSMALNACRGNLQRISGESDAVESFALTVYRQAMVDGYDWGTTAIVASGAYGYGTSVVAQLAYQAAAPVFLTSADGTLSNQTIQYIAQGGFDRIIIAGTATYVSESAESALKSGTGVTPERVLTNTSSAYDNSLDFASFMLDEYRYINSADVLITADATDDAMVAMASTIAARRNGIVLTTASSADEKTLVARMQAEGLSNFKTIYLFNASASLQEKIDAAYPSAYDTSLVDGDTIESEGFLFTYANGEVAYDSTLNPAAGTSIPSSITYNGVTYPVKADSVNNPGGTGGNGGNGGTGGGKNTNGKSKAQTIKVKPAKKTIKAAKVKTKAKKITFKVSGAKGKLVAKASGKKSKKALKVKAKGKKKVIVTLKKKAKKGTYKIKVYAAKSGAYAQSATKKITIKVK